MVNMLLTYRDCRERFGKPYQIDGAVADGRLRKIEPGIYSDGGNPSELAVIQFKYPKGILAFESAYLYYDLTDSIPERYALATPANATAIRDPRVKQYYVPTRIYGLGITEIARGGDRIRVYDRERVLVDTARMKNLMAVDLYKEVIGNFRKRIAELDPTKIADYLEQFPKRSMIERIIDEEVF